MKAQLVYQWIDDDPSLAFVQHAMNRLQSFVASDDDPQPVNRVLKGNQFTDEDIQRVGLYLRTLAARARDRWGKLLQLPAENDTAFAASVFQAADAAEQAAFDMEEIFSTLRVSGPARRGQRGAITLRTTTKRTT